MNKNTIIGFVLIAITFFAFTFYQSKTYEKQVAIQHRLDSIAKAKRIQDSIEYTKTHQQDSVKEHEVLVGNKEEKIAIYADSSLEKASKEAAKILTLKNDKLEVEFTTKGAQPYSARIYNYKNYNGTDLYLFKPGDSEFGIILYAGATINTKNFVFNVVENTDSTLVMQLPFEGGGYIQQKYILERNSYSIHNTLSFIGMNNIIPKNVTSFDTDWKLTIPRMEKGYRNEVNYSKLDYYYQGDSKPKDIHKNDERIENKLSWFAFQQQFFSAIMRAKNQFSSGLLSINFFPEEDTTHNLMTCTANMRTDLQMSSKVDIPYEFYFGPNNYRILKSYDQNYEKIIPLGGSIIGWFTKLIIIPVFTFLHKFISNYGIIILLMTIFIKLLVLPFTYKSYSSTAKMQVLKPEVDKLNEKYPKQEDAMKKQQATMNLYRRAGVSPMGGCLPMLLQMPILWAMFRFFPASIELRQQHFLWADDLSSYDSILNFGFHIPLLGNHISLFALLMAVSMFFYSKMNSGAQMSGNDSNAATMKFMSIYLMPIMMFFICNNLSAGLSYYYLLSNLITMLETWIIKKYFVHPEEILARLKASEGKPMPKSKWQIRLEQAQKMQQQRIKDKNKR